MLTRAVDYAIRMLIFLSKKEKGTLVTRKEISEKCQIPPLFLAKIAQNLAKYRIINIIQGSKGGYVLLKDPSELTLLQIIEIMSGKIFLNQCIKNKEACEYSSMCYIHKIWFNLTEKLREELNKINFQELAENDSCFIV